MASGKILIVDDDRNICELLRLYIEKEGFETAIANDGKAAVQMFDAVNPDLILLDIMLPELDGWQVCREIRKKSQCPIIMLTAKGEVFDKVLGLELGADDYVVKPFKPRELVARVRARLRRPASPARRVLEARGVALDEDAYEATLHGEALPLTPKEFAILACLLRAQGRPVSSRDLFEEVWKEEANVQSNNTVMVHIRHLRKKLAAVDSSQELVETVWGVGYKLG